MGFDFDWDLLGGEEPTSEGDGTPGSVADAGAEQEAAEIHGRGTDIHGGGEDIHGGGESIHGGPERNSDTENIPSSSDSAQPPTQLMEIRLSHNKADNCCFGSQYQKCDVSHDAVCKVCVKSSAVAGGISRRI